MSSVLDLVLVQSKEKATSQITLSTADEEQIANWCTTSTYYTEIQILLKIFNVREQ